MLSITDIATFLKFNGLTPGKYPIIFRYFIYSDILSNLKVNLYQSYQDSCWTNIFFGNELSCFCIFLKWKNISFALKIAKRNGNVSRLTKYKISCFKPIVTLPWNKFLGHHFVFIIWMYCECRGSISTWFGVIRSPITKKKWKHVDHSHIFNSTKIIPRNFSLKYPFQMGIV